LIWFDLRMLRGTYLYCYGVWSGYSIHKAREKYHLPIQNKPAPLLHIILILNGKNVLRIRLQGR